MAAATVPESVWKREVTERYYNQQFADDEKKKKKAPANRKFVAPDGGQIAAPWRVIRPDKMKKKGVNPSNPRVDMLRTGLEMQDMGKAIMQEQMSRADVAARPIAMSEIAKRMIAEGLKTQALSVKGHKTRKKTY